MVAVYVPLFLPLFTSPRATTSRPGMSAGSPCHSQTRSPKGRNFANSGGRDRGVASTREAETTGRREPLADQNRADAVLHRYAAAHQLLADGDQSPPVSRCLRTNDDAPTLPQRLQL